MPTEIKQQANNFRVNLQLEIYVFLGFFLEYGRKAILV